MAGPYLLLQFGSDPFSHRFEDLESRPAFTVKIVHETPNIVVQVAREAEWSQQHPDIMGPSNAFLYFGPSKSPGFLAYGNGQEVKMADHVRQKKGGTSRYFTTQNGKEMKWKVFPQKMECIDGRTTVATWELSQPEDMFSARITIKHAGLSVVTEILTTLALIRMGIGAG
ncbi:hypothetical protein HYDPIDRAFT_22984 [Hydnomerulius pinastri MD-312]|nr:hypothetical protein HYDPIDRAFT_22984 [Hydnomerulius pinastri MD-312]